MTPRELGRYRHLRAYFLCSPRLARDEARRWAAISDEQHAANRASADRALTDALDAARVRDYEEKWAPHSEPAAPDEWAAHAFARDTP